MYYHVGIQFGDKTHYWWNYSKDNLLTDLVLPYINKQVKPVTRKGIRELVSFGSASYLVITKTKQKLKRAGVKSPPELSRPSFWKDDNCTDEILDELRIAGANTPAFRSLLQRVFTPPQRRAFTVMKFDDPFLNSSFARVIVPVCARFNLEAYRVDKVQDSGVINEQILDSIASSRVVIADLTGERPNCYYETGYAQALGKDVILLIHEGQTIHFDLRTHRFITWQTELDLEAKLTERLTVLSAKWEAGTASGSF